MKSLLTGTIVILAGVAAQSSAADVGGKVVSLQGQVTKEHDRSPSVALTVGSIINAGDTIRTAANSSVKLVLKDATEMNIGPQSQFKVEDLGNAERPGVFSMMYGALRAKVSKSVNGDIKAVIKTKSSTMGVRGTDFQAISNPQTQTTSLVTFEGAVAMTKADPGVSVSQMVANLTDTSLSVTVSQGQFAGVSNSQQQPSVPVKISPAQLETLKSNSNTASSSNSNATATNAQSSAAGAGTQNVGAAAATKILSPIPPGIDAKLVSGSTSDLQRAASATLGSTTSTLLSASLSQQSKQAAAAPAEGSYNAATGQAAPPAGGFVDLKTGVYVPPPPGSAYDPVAGVYIPPASMGSFNSQTGNYVPPAGLALDAVKGFVPAGTASTANISGNTSAANSSSTANTNAGPSNSGIFAGMRPQTFGADMTAAPPPPGSSVAQFTATPGVIPPSAGSFVFAAGSVAPPPPGGDPNAAGAKTAIGSGTAAGVPGFGGAVGVVGPGGVQGIAPPPGGFIPNYNGLQPNYPVYNPGLCPPFCDPQSQPGAPPPPPGGGGTIPPTVVNFTIT